MTPVSEFTLEIRMEMPNCIDGVIDRAVIHSAIEFCRETDAWTYTHEDVPLVTDVSEYEFWLPEDTIIQRILNMENASGDQVEEKSQTWLGSNAPLWRTATGAIVEHITFTESPTFLVTPIPTADDADGLTGIRLSLLPVVGATSIGDVLANRYFETICFGAKARLFNMAGVAWSNPEIALQQRAWFDAGMKKAGNKFVINKKSTFRPTSYAKQNTEDDDGL